MDLKDIKAIIDLMRRNSIAEFELERQDFKIRLKRMPETPYAVAAEEQVAPVAAAGRPIAAVPAQALAQAVPMATQPAPVELEIKSPMIGTFYRAPSPESASYVEVGSEVNPDTVVCIIEAMKVMNEIKAEAKGIITQVLVENGKPVEFGQPLFKLRPT